MDKQRRPKLPSHVIRKRRRRKRRIRFIFSLLLFCLVIGLSAFGYASWRVDQALDDLIDPSSNQEQQIENRQFSVLIMGRDYRPETETNLTDVMIVAAVDLDKGKVSMASIPRDTKVRISEIGRQVKANEAFNIGEYLKRQEEQKQKPVTIDGPAVAKKMASRLFEVPIDYYVLVDFKSFMAIVDEIGGIDIHVERELIYNDPTDDTHIHLYPGPQHVNGKEALDWVRHRHDDRGTDYYSSDFDRNKRQREVIAAVASEMKTFDGATKIFDVLDTMAHHIQTDLSKSQIKSLVWSLKQLDPNQIESIETPNVYWDSSSLQTVIPEEDLNVVHTKLQEVLNKEKNG